MKKHMRLVIAAMAVVSVFGGMYVLPGNDGIGIFDTVVYAGDMMSVDPPVPNTPNKLIYDNKPVDLLSSDLCVREGNPNSYAHHYYISTSDSLNPKEIDKWIYITDVKVQAPGVYYVYYMVDEYAWYDTYYCSEPVCVTVTAKEQPLLTIEYTQPEQLELSYNGEPQALCDEIQVNEPSLGATVEYKLADTDWSDKIPAAKDVGEYTVYYRITADNYTTVEGSVTAEIKRVYTLHEAVTPVDMDNPGHQAYWTDENGTYYTKDGEEYTETDYAALVVPYFTLKEESGGYTVTGYNGDDSIVTVPAEYNSLPIKKIGTKAFRNIPITSVTLCGITVIGTQAFDGCSSLETIVCESEIVNIDQSAISFSGVKDLILAGGISADMTSGTIPADTTVYVYTGSAAVMGSYYTDEMHLSDTNKLVTMQWVWNGSECSLVLKNHFSGAAVDTIEAEVTESGGEYTASAVLCGYTLTDTAVQTGITCQMDMNVDDSSRVNSTLYIPDIDGCTVYIDGNELGSESYDADKGEYFFNITSAAKNMDEIHTITIERNGNIIYTKEISAAMYLKAVTEDANCSDYHSTAKAMLCYGAAAQKYFIKGISDDKLVNNGVSGAGFELIDSISPENTAPSKEAIDSAVTSAGLDKYISYYGMNMSFTADTTLIMAFGLKDTEKTAEATAALSEAITPGSGFDVTVDTDNTGRYLIVRARSIPIRKLGTTAFSLGGMDIKGTDVVIKMMYGSSDTDVVRLCKGLYNYYEEASKLVID